MIADGLTKGKCERDSVATAMGGVFTRKHEVKSWTAPQAVYSEAALLSTSTGSHQDRSVAVGRNGLTLADDSIGPHQDRSVISAPTSSFCMAWPYVAMWIAENRTALMKVAYAWRSEDHEHIMRQSLYAFYNWRWREDRLSDTDSSEELLEDDDPQSHWPINDDEHIA
jgi:hypothetical protein